MVGPMARPGARGLGPGLGLKYEIVLRAGPGHNCCGPGPIIQFAGRARARSAQLLRASNHVCGPGLGLDFRPVQGPNVRSQENIQPKLSLDTKPMTYKYLQC